MRAAVGAMLMGVVCALTLPSRAAVVPTPGAADPRVRTARYDPEQVYRLQGYAGLAIDLEFAPDEFCTGVGGGDVDGLIVGTTANHLTLKPKVVPLASNFFIFTNRRAYRIEYRAERAPADALRDVIYAVRFTYRPGKTQAAGPTKTQDAARQKETVDAAPARPKPALNTDYWYCGDAELQPIAAYDDGRQTHLKFAPDTEWPAIYLHEPDGREYLVSFSVHDGEAVIHRVAVGFVLRRGNLVGCVGNRPYARRHRHERAVTIPPALRRRVEERR